MKFFYDLLSLTFLTVSAIIGAGFLSGREIVAFFGTDGFLPFIIFSFIISAAFFYLCYYSGAKEKSLEDLNGRLFTYPKCVGVAVYVASFISASGAASGITALFSVIFPTIKIPIFALIFIIAADFVSVKGVIGVEKISFVLTPLLVVTVAILIVFCGKTDFSTENVNAVKGGLKTVLYASMNCFINLPALTDGARGKGKKTLIFSAILSALIISFLALFIAASIKGAKTSFADTPLLFAVGGSPIFAASLLFALITSLFSAYYPLYNFANKKGKIVGVVSLTIAVFSFSLLGVKNIIDGIYPVIGVMGAVYLIKCFIYAVRCRYKKPAYEHNKDKKEKVK